MNIKNLIIKPIFIVGLMGAGKTTLGKALAEELSLDFVDSDALIVEQAGMSIPDLFDVKGEEYFRTLERQVILKLAQSNTPKVVGLGGGAFINDETRSVIKAQGLSMFLNADLETLAQRVGNGEGRPLLAGQDVKSALSKLIEARYSIYGEADLSAAMNDEPLQQSVERVIDALYTHLNP